MNITILNGTSRINNQSQHAAQAVATAVEAADKNVTVTRTNVGEHLAEPVTVPPWGEGGADSKPTSWKQLVAATDRFVFVLPEYNHSFPGEWKLLMDSLFKEYAGKVVYIVAVGGGQFAGARVMEHVLPVLVNFQFVIANDRLHISHASKTFASDGSLADPETQKRVTTFASAVVSA